LPATSSNQNGLVALCRCELLETVDDQQTGSLVCALTTALTPDSQLRTVDPQGLAQALRSKLTYPWVAEAWSCKRSKLRKRFSKRGQRECSNVDLPLPCGPTIAERGVLEIASTSRSIFCAVTASLSSAANR
jgi:hypothetical protein